MKTDFTKPFDKDVNNIIDVALLEKIEQAILNVEEAPTTREIRELRKLKGFKEGIFYRIKIGGYRIGVTIEGGLVTFARCLPRKNFYKKFP